MVTLNYQKTNGRMEACGLAQDIPFHISSLPLSLLGPNFALRYLILIEFKGGYLLWDKCDKNF
jgi:hypothetical protein